MTISDACKCKHQLLLTLPSLQKSAELQSELAIQCKPFQAFHAYVMQVTSEALAGAEEGLQELPSFAKRTGTYVGCMFVDHMHLLQQGYGFPSTGPIMTGKQTLFSSPIFPSGSDSFTNLCCSLARKAAFGMSKKDLHIRQALRSHG